MTTEPKCLPGCKWNDYAPSQWYHAPGCPNAEAPKVERRKDSGIWRCHSRGTGMPCPCYHNGYGCPNERREVQRSTGWSKDERGKPAPAPEPKQGSEEYPTIQPAVDEWVEYWKRSEDQPQDIERKCPWGSVARAYLALRAEVEELKADKERRKGSAVDRLHNLCDGFDEMDKEQQAKIDALRAQLAEKDREIDRLDLRWQEVNDQLASAREEIAKLREESANAWTMDDVAEAQATERAAREKAEKEWDYFDRRATEAKARVRELAKAAQAVVDVRPDLPNTLRGEIESLAAILAKRKGESK